MKIITIVTHDIDNEIKVINPSYSSTEFEFQENGMKIKVIRKRKSSTENELNDIADEDGNENILLFHLVDQQFSKFSNWHSSKFDIGTKGYYMNKNEDRIEYEKILNANSNGSYDWAVFDKVWDYFSKKIVGLRLKKIQEKYFDECIKEGCWKEIPTDFQTITIINKWNELSKKTFDGQAEDYDDFYKMFEGIYT
jgi:hypothetical protein